MPTDERRVLLRVRMLAPDPDIPGNTIVVIDIDVPDPGDGTGATRRHDQVSVPTSPDERGTIDTARADLRGRVSRWDEPWRDDLISALERPLGTDDRTVRRP